jgi:hypothetical protein
MDSALRKEYEDYAALLRLGNMRRASGIMNESTCRIIVYAVVKHAGYHEDLFRAGSVGIKGQELGTGVDFENLGLGAIRALPENTHTNPRKDFLGRKLSPIRRNYAFKVNHHHSSLADAS